MTGDRYILFVPVGFRSGTQAAFGRVCLCTLNTRCDFLTTTTITTMEFEKITNEFVSIHQTRYKLIGFYYPHLHGDYVRYTYTKRGPAPRINVFTYIFLPCTRISVCVCLSIFRNCPFGSRRDVYGMCIGTAYPSTCTNHIHPYYGNYPVYIYHPG